MESLFEELGDLLDYIWAGLDLNEFYPQSLEVKIIKTLLVNGCSLNEAILVACEEQNSQLGRLLFGSIKPCIDPKSQYIVANNLGRSLYVIFQQITDKIEISSAGIGEVSILCTNFKAFTYWRTNKGGFVSKPFATYNTSDLCEEIAFTGSIWDSIFPTHYAIVSRTISYTFAQGTSSALFSAILSADAEELDEETVAYNRLKCFENPLTKVVSLETLCKQMESCSRPPKLLLEYKEQGCNLRQYSPQRSSIFDFGTPSEELNRADFVTSYIAGDHEFHREFFISPSKWGANEEELLIASFDILHMLAIRRTKLFRIAFASRVYNILLPPILLIDANSMSHGYSIFPCLNLYRTSRKDFRRTLSITFITCPVDVICKRGRIDSIISRSAPIEELYRLKDELLLSISDEKTKSKLRKYTTRGFGKLYYKGLPHKFSIPELLQNVARGVLNKIFIKAIDDDGAIDCLVNSTLFNSNLKSKMATMSLEVDWNPPKDFRQPWERWLATGNDTVFRNALFRTLFYWDYLDPFSADASHHAVRFEELNVGNTMGADMGGMTLYNPQESLKVVLYPKTREYYPNYSIVRWMTWQVYINSALASLRALISKFHPVLENRGDLHSIIGTLDEMIQEFVDFYDLDIKDYFYRKEYEKLRILMQVDDDYAQLLAKFASSKDDEQLREQRLINKLILSLTIVTVTITIISTIAQIGWISVPVYLVIAIVLSLVMVWVGYVLFDPIRHKYKQIYNNIRRYWR